VGKKFEPDNVITIDLLSLPSGGPAGVAAQPVAPRSKKQKAAPQQPKAAEAVEKVVQKAAQVKAEKTTELAAPEVEEVAEVAEPTQILPVVAPKKKLKVVTKIVPKSAAPPEPIAQAKSVSLHPLKRKKKIAEDIRLAEVKERVKREKQQAQQKLQQEREQLAASEKKRLVAEGKREKAAEQERKLATRKKKQQAAEKKKKQADQQRRKREISEAGRLARQAEQAAEQARLEAARARKEYASVAQAVSDLNTPLVSSDSGFSSGGYSEGYGGSSGRESGGYGGHGSERVNPAVLNQYAASLNGRISSHWQLPETVKTKPHLRTMVALTLRRDGFIKDMRIERESGDSFFDQSVIKALRNAAPFPGFPALMNQRTQEFVLNFTPQGLAL
ncbi:cell envelope integrity protein TolA, partial [Desulfobulbus sp. US2]|nr:cell envelope integrity protein TolA [Desulfobulbus sp. US2]